MAAKLGDVVFQAGDGVNMEGFWDDSALIKAYDKAINSFKYGSADSTESPSGKKKNRRKRKKNKRQSKDSGDDEFEDNPAPTSSNWAIGDTCQAVFSEDGLVYNAEVIDIYNEANSCLVRYAEYWNEEEQFLTDLIALSETPLVDNDDNIEQNNVQNGEYSSASEASKPISTEWYVSDLCTAPELPHHHLHEAVINSFPSQFTCKVTFIRSRKSQEVNIEDIQRSDCHRHHNGHNHGPSNGHFNPPFPPMHHPPPHMAGNPHYYPYQPPRYPTPPFDRRWPPGRNPRETNNYTKGIPRPPVPPPPPPMSLDDPHSDDETLASMLMSWYLSGYHTGYFKAAQQFRNNATRSDETLKSVKEYEPTTSKQSPKQTDMDTKQ